MSKSSEVLRLRAAKSEDEKARMAALVRGIEELGPNINEISRRVGLFKETARYLYKKRIIDKGMNIIGDAAYGRFGLQRLTALARVREEYRPYIHQIFMAMADYWPVVHYQRTIPDDRLLVSAEVPEDVKEEFASTLRDLRDKLRFFTDVEVFDVGWIYRVPMHAEQYDFVSSKWEVQWNSLKDPPPDLDHPSLHQLSKFDMLDILVASELQMPGGASVAETARKLKISYKSALLHYAHVRDRKLISGYRIRWFSREFNDAALQLTRSHAYAFISLIVKDVTPEEAKFISRELQRLPFIWAVTGGGTSFIADFYAPVEFWNETLVFIRDLLGHHAERLEVLTFDQRQDRNYTLPQDLYDPKLKRWRYDKQKVLKNFERTLRNVVSKQNGSPTKKEGLETAS